MRFFLLLSIFLLFSAGCSSNNAFSSFNITQYQERAEDVIESSRILKDGITKGFVTIVYLNRVYPERYKKEEHFYISFYIQGSDESVNFILNKERPLLVKKLEKGNSFANLLSQERDWQNYYHVVFEKTQKEKMQLTLTSKGYSSKITLYKESGE